MVPLSASAWGFGIVQGDVVSQADVGAEGFPEPLAEERRLPCGRRFREQEGAVQGEKSRVKEPHPPCTQHTVPRFSRHSCWKTHGSLFPVVSIPSLTSPLRTGAVSSVPRCLTSPPCWPPWCPRRPRVHGRFPPCQPPYTPAEPGLASVSSTNAHWPPSVPEGDRLILGSLGEAFHLSPAFMFQGFSYLSSSSQLRGVLCTVTGRGMSLPGTRTVLRMAQGSVRVQQMSSASSAGDTQNPDLADRSPHPYPDSFTHLARGGTVQKVTRQEPQAVGLLEAEMQSGHSGLGFGRLNLLRFGVS